MRLVESSGTEISSPSGRGASVCWQLNFGEATLLCFYSKVVSIDVDPNTKYKQK